MKFVPANSYELLLKQANAMANLIDSQEKAIVQYESKRNELSEKYLQSLKDNLESERAMNAELTKEVAKLENALVELNQKHISLCKAVKGY